MKKTKLHVAIIGAGLGGLCLAQGLHKHQISFDVYERDEGIHSRPQGYRIRIDNNGKEALKACLSRSDYELFQLTSSISPAKVSVIDPNLLNASGWVDSWKESAADDPQRDLSVNRLTLREILLRGVQSKVHFGKSFVRYEHAENQKLRIFFGDGTCVMTDILIAADGANSLFMEQWAPHLKPMETGAVCIYGKTWPTPDLLNRLPRSLQTGTTIVFDNKLASIVDVMQFQKILEPAKGWIDEGLSAIDDYIYWALIGQKSAFYDPDSEELLNKNNDVLPMVKYAIRAWNPVLRLLYESAEASNILKINIRTSQPIQAWQPGSVTVLGDAIHTMSPAGGVGANTAFRDADVLVQSLYSASLGEISFRQAVANYESKMRIYATEAIEESIRGSRKLYGA